MGRSTDKLRKFSPGLTHCILKGFDVGPPFFKRGFIGFGEKNRKWYMVRSSPIKETKIHRLGLLTFIDKNESIQQVRAIQQVAGDHSNPGISFCQ